MDLAELDEIVQGKSSKPLTDWANPPKVTDLKQDLTEAQSAHDSQISKIEGWLDNLNITGSAVVDAPSGRSKIVPKLIRKQAEWRYSALAEPFLSTQDLFNVSPVSWEDKTAARQNALVLNNQFNTKINKVRFIDELVRACVDEGTAVCRVGWLYEDKTETVTKPIFQYSPFPDEQLAQQYQQILELKTANPLEYKFNVPDELKQGAELFAQSGMPMQPIPVGEEEVEETVVIKNHPTLEVCDIRNIIIDPTCEGDIDKANFVIYQFETNLSNLKKDGRYKNLDSINLDSVSVLAEPDYASPDESSFKFKDKPRQKFVAYEYWGYWDIDGEGITKPIVATWVGNTMIRLEESPFPDGKPPFVLVQYLPVRRSIYGEPDGALLEDNQKIVGAVTRGMIDIMGRSANGQLAIRKDALDVVNRRKFEKGLDYEFNPAVDPRQAFHMHTYPEIPQSAQYMINLQNMEAESLTGVKAFTQGISGNSLGNTATGVRGAMDATAKREAGILRRIAKGVVELGRKIIAMNAVFLSEEEVVRVTNEEFIIVKKDDLYGNFDLRLDISTPEANNEKAQELAFMLQTMGNSMPMDMSKMILSDIARLRKMPDLAKRIEEYQPQPDPMQQKQAELQLALLEAQVFNERAKGEENAADIELKKAKTATELANAKATKSKADLDDLTFLEREKGIDHNRNLELQQQKMEGDMMKERMRNISKASTGK